jgi:hypothetical protein
MAPVSGKAVSGFPGWSSQNPDFACCTLRLIVGRSQENLEGAHEVAASRMLME